MSILSYSLAFVVCTLLLVSAPTSTVATSVQLQSSSSVSSSLSSLSSLSLLEKTSKCNKLLLGLCLFISGGKPNKCHEKHHCDPHKDKPAALPRGAATSLAPTTSPRPKPRPADLNTQSSLAPTTSLRPKPRPADLNTQSSLAPTTSLRPKPRPADLNTQSSLAPTTSLRPKARPADLAERAASAASASAASTGAAGSGAVSDSLTAEFNDGANVPTTISLALLKKINPNVDRKVVDKAGFITALNDALAWGHLNTCQRYCAFLAQCMHESGDFKYVQEIASGASYQGRMGNIHPGDGKRFKGRGWLQITGRDNYTAFQQATGVDALKHPKLLTTTKNAWMASVWFWNHHNLNHDADTGTLSGFHKTTKIINGGHNGQADRDKLWHACRRHVGCK
jgi:predicted chitinase